MFGCDGTVLLPLLFRTSGITTLASCPGSYPSLLAYRALDPLMDLSSLLPGTFFLLSFVAFVYKQWLMPLGLE